MEELERAYAILPLEFLTCRFMLSFREFRYCSCPEEIEKHAGLALLPTLTATPTRAAWG